MTRGLVPDAPEQAAACNLANQQKEHASVKSCIMNALEAVRGGGGAGVQDPQNLLSPLAPGIPGSIRLLLRWISSGC